MKHEFKFELDTKTKQMKLVVNYNGISLGEIVLDEEISQVISIIVEDIIVENSEKEMFLDLARKEIEALTA